MSLLHNNFPIYSNLEIIKKIYPILIELTNYNLQDAIEWLTTPVIVLSADHKRNDPKSIPIRLILEGKGYMIVDLLEEIKSGFAL